MTGQKIKTPKRQATVIDGIATYITFFLVSILLYFQNDYFGSSTNLVAFICVVIGIMGMGNSLDKAINSDFGERNNLPKNTEFFGNLGLATGLFLICLVVSRTVPSMLVKVITAPFFFLSYMIFISSLVYLWVLGMIRSSQDTIDSSQTADNRKQQKKVFKILALISGIIGFIASLIQILQFLKII